MLRTSINAMAAALCLVPCLAQEGASWAVNGEIKIAYWTQGPEDGPPLVLVNGQGAATRVDGDALVEAFVAEGFHVITFDNRDSGRSTLLRDAGPPSDMLDSPAAGSDDEKPDVAYDLSDMADDAIAVLDAAGIEQAHFVGHSLGGMIAQMVAIDHPDRVLSMVSVSATSGETGLPYGPALAALSDPATFADMDVVAMQVRAYRIFEGEAHHRMADSEVAARVAADMVADDPHAANRQATAATATGDRRKRLQKIPAPALVLHGSDDPWFPIEHAESTASALGAPLVIVDGMGHIIADAVAAAVAAQVADLIRSLPPL